MQFAALSTICHAQGLADIASTQEGKVDTPPSATSNSSALIASAREPLASAEKTTDSYLNAIIWKRSAKDALRAGLPSVTLSIYSQLEDSLGEDVLYSDPEDIRVAASAMLDLGQLDEVRSFLFAHPVAEEWWDLYMALVTVLNESNVESGEIEFDIDDDKLPEELLPWYNLLLGLEQSRKGDVKDAADYYAKAMEEGSDALKAQLELLLLKDQLGTGEASNAVVADLKQRMRDLHGQRSGFESARLLAIALRQLGRDSEALSVLDEQLRYIGIDEDGMREQMLMLVGIIAGPESNRGKVALQQVLINASAPRELLEQALTLLTSANAPKDDSGRNVLGDIIQSVITQDPRHPLMDKLLLLRSDIFVRSGRYEEAATDAQEIIDRFPASSLRLTALRTLAYLSFTREPPQYRTAASYLSQLRREMPDGALRASIGVLMADCFFLNGDYSNAASIYGDLRDEPCEDMGIVFYQQMLSLLKANMLNEAARELDSLKEPSKGISIDPMHRWKAEWNLIHTLRIMGRSEDAFSRLAMLLDDNSNEELPQSLRLRLMWLHAQLSLDAGRTTQTPERCQVILDTLKALPEGVIDDSQKALISSHTLLLMAQAKLALSDERGAVETLEVLRNSYKDSSAAQDSFLVQARWLSSKERLVEAQQLLLALADQYKDSQQAPIALWEAAIAAEQRGLEATYREALSILDRLINEHPGSNLVFFARLRQGDILRKLNDFSTALLAYEDLINRFPQHSLLHLAQMSKADCIIAQSSHNPARRANGTSIYERLMERRDLPAAFRAEASFKWAFNLAKAGDSARAIDAYWLAVNRYLDSENRAEFGAKGSYWVARSAVELGQLLEAAKRYDQARKVYNIILSTEIPGHALARARIKRLDEPRSE